MDKKVITLSIIIILLLIANLFCLYSLRPKETEVEEAVVEIDCKEQYRYDISLLEEAIYELENNDYTIEEQVNYIKILDDRLKELNFILLKEQEKIDSQRNEVQNLMEILTNLKQMKSKLESLNDN